MSSEAEPDSASKAERALPPPLSSSPQSTSPSSSGGEAPSAWNDAPPVTPTRSGRFPLILTLFLLIVLAALAYAGWLGWQRFEALDARTATLARSQQGVEEELMLLSRRLDEQRQTSAAHEALANRAVAATQDLERRLGEAVATLRNQMALELRQTLDGVTRPVLVPVDIERLLLIASDAVTLARDPGIALAALRLADRRLAALDDPVFAETRRLLAEDIAALEEAKRPDVAGVVHALDALQSRIPELRSQLRSEPRENDASTTSGGDDAAAESPWWRRLITDVAASLRELVVLRRTGVDDKPLPPPGMEELAAQNLHLRLEAARIALLSRDIDAFNSSLQSLDEWLRNWYRTDQPAVAAMLEQIGRISGFDPRLALPDVSDTLSALREALAKRGASPVYGIEPADESGAEEIPPEPAPTDDSEPGADSEAEMP